MLRYDETAMRWLEVERRKTHKVPAWMRLDLELDGTPLELVAPTRREDDRAGLSREGERTERRAPQLEPQLLILSSGELSPFSLRLSERKPAVAPADRQRRLPPAEAEPLGERR